MRLLFVFIFLLLAKASPGQALSESSIISLLTASPGEELYSTFGHSAIRVQDPAQRLDVVYNYGTFNPYIDHFYIKFARRKVDYFLSKNDFDGFSREYIAENRSVVEQVLNLDTGQKNELYAALLENYKPENRAYRYDFFFDNCATRIRDIFPDALGEAFSYHCPQEWEKGDMTFRNLIDLYLTHHHWSDFGIDLALGLPTDQIATPSDYMFLPDYLFEGMATATIIRDGQPEPFVLSTSTIIPRQEMQPKTFLVTPVMVCWALFVLTVLLSWYGYRKQKRLVWYDVFYFTVIGVIGWVVFLLDHATDHIATKDNLNVLWAVPLHLPIFLFWWKLPWRFFRFYVWACLMVDLVILASWWGFPQNFHHAFLPLILAMIIRYVMMLWFQKNVILKR